MLDLTAPDPFSLASWVSNAMPVDDPDARAWWFVSIIAVVTGRTVIDDRAAELGSIAPRASA